MYKSIYVHTYVHMHTYVRMYVVHMHNMYVLIISVQVTSLRSEKDVLKQRMEKMKEEIESC